MYKEEIIKSQLRIGIKKLLQEDIKHKFCPKYRMKNVYLCIIGDSIFTAATDKVLDDKTYFCKRLYLTGKNLLSASEHLVEKAKLGITDNVIYFEKYKSDFAENFINNLSEEWQELIWQISRVFTDGSSFNKAKAIVELLSLEDFIKEENVNGAFFELLTSGIFEGDN